jgi:FMN reductase
VYGIPACAEQLNGWTARGPESSEAQLAQLCVLLIISIKMTYPIFIQQNDQHGGAEPAMAILAVDGSPTGGGKTRTAIEAVAQAGEPFGARIEAVALAEPDGPERALQALETADAVIFGAPVYRAAAAAPLKQLLDLIPRDNLERRSPLAAKPVAIVQTGATLHHFLALDGLRNVLAGFFAAHVIAPGLYIPRDGFGEVGLLEPYARHARTQGEALIELMRAVNAGVALAAVRPQA